MPRGRIIKIEVSRDTQPQFELGDTAETIERRRKREERDERQRREQGERERRRIEREEGRQAGKDRKETLNRHIYLCRIHSIQKEEGPNKVYFP